MKLVNLWKTFAVTALIAALPALACPAHKASTGDKGAPVAKNDASKGKAKTAKSTAQHAAAKSGTRSE
jgi:hypothetical protein